MALSRKIYKSYKKKVGWPYFLVLIIILLFGATSYLLITNKKEGGVTNPIKFIQNKTESVEKKETKEIVAELEAYLAQQKGMYGYYVIELDDGRSFGNRDEEKFIAASTVKVAYFTYLYSQIEAGKVDIETVLTYTSADYESGTGSLQESPFGSKYEVAYLAEVMITESDNVATQMLKRYLGKENLQNYLNNNGFSEIDIINNQVSPKAMAGFLEATHKGALISEDNAEVLFGYMKNSITPTRLVAGVPKGVAVAHKIGSWTEAMSDVGVVFYDGRPYVITVYSEGVAWGETTDAVIAEISKKVYEFESSF